VPARPELVVRAADEAGQLDPLTLHRDDGQEKRLRDDAHYALGVLRDDGDGEVAAHLVPAQGPGSSPHADAEPTGVHAQALTVVLDAGDPNETADYYGQRHDHHAGESVVESSPGEECKGAHEHHVAGEHP